MQPVTRDTNSAFPGFGWTSPEPGFLTRLLSENRPAISGAGVRQEFSGLRLSVIHSFLPCKQKINIVLAQKPVFRNPASPCATVPVGGASYRLKAVYCSFLLLVVH